MFSHEIDLEKRDLSHYRKMRVLDPSDCAKFYQCLELRNGTIVTTHYSCPACEFFSEEHKQCVSVHTGPMCGMLLVFRNLELQDYINYYTIQSYTKGGSIHRWMFTSFVYDYPFSVMC